MCLFFFFFSFCLVSEKIAEGNGNLGSLPFYVDLVLLKKESLLIVVTYCV